MITHAASGRARVSGRQDRTLAGSRPRRARALALVAAMLVFGVALALGGCDVLPGAGSPDSPTALATGSQTNQNQPSELVVTPVVTAPSSVSRPTTTPRARPVGTPASATVASGTIRLAGSDSSTLDPALSQEVSSWSYLIQIFSGLVSLDDQLRIIPDLAESWDVSPDGRSYTFHLRPGARFHNGKEVTASDFKYSLERALDPATQSPVALTYLGDIVGAADRQRGSVDHVDGIVVLDSRTLQLTIDAPKTYFLAKLTYPTAFVLDRENVEAAGAKSGSPWFASPNGTGPFRLESWKPDEEIILARNDAYYRDPAALQKVSYWLAPGSAVSRYETDQLDVVEVGTSDIERVTDPRGAFESQLIRAPQLGLWYLGFGVTKPPFDDEHVRRAFAYATDKRRLAEVTMKKMGVPAAGVLPPGLAGYDVGYRGLEFDPVRAKQELTQSRYAGHLPEVVLTMGEGGDSMGETLAEMYSRNLGIDVGVEQVVGGYFAGLDAHEYQMFYLGWSADYPDPEDFLDVLFHSGSGLNHGGYSDQDVDSLLDQARVELDSTTRNSLYQRAQTRIVESAAVVPMFFNTDFVLVKPRVSGLNWTPMGLLSLRSAQLNR